MDAVDDIFVPAGGGEVGEEANELEKEADADGLEACQHLGWTIEEIVA